jgi:hypothetical protein
MLRPERLNLGQNGDGIVRGTVQDVIYQGAERRLIIDLTDGTEVIATSTRDEPPVPIAAGRRDLAALGGRRAVPAPRAARRSSGPRRPTSTRSQASLDGASSPRSARPPPPPPPERRFGRRVADHRRWRSSATWPPSSAAVLLVTGAVTRARRPTPGRRGGRRRGVGTGDTTVRILNWPAYIDPTEDGATGTIDRFRDATGIAVTTARTSTTTTRCTNGAAPLLERGQPIAYDIVCPTNWMRPA